MANNYQIALTNVPFDNEFNNVLRFGSRQEQEAYFDVNTLFLNAPKVNFNVGAFEITNVFVNYPAGTDLTSLMNNNYAIVKDTTNNIYYYYFVEMCLQDSGTQLALNLKMDIFQTYYIDVDFTDCNIRRAHLDRFTDNGDNTVSFIGGVNSRLFSNEKFAPLAKRLTKRTKLELNVDSNQNSAFNEWLHKVAYWQYIFVSSGVNYDFNGVSRSLMPIYYYDSQYPTGDIDGGCSVLCFPVMKSNTFGGLKITDGNETLSINLNSLLSFKSQNNNTSYFYASKISIMPPFIYGNYDPTTYSVSGDTLTLNVTSSNPFLYGMGDLDFYKLQTGIAILNVRSQYNIPLKANYTLNDNFSFSKNSVKNGYKDDLKFNPKLLSENFKELKIVSETDGFVYDIQKLNNKDLTILYNEPITPDITRGYARIETTGIYINKCADNYTGLVIAQDNSLPIQNDYLSSWLASNKNYFLQATVTATKNAVSGAIGGAVAGGAEGAGIGALTSLARSAFDFANLELSIDNMRNAPSIMKNANGNAPLNAVVNTIGIYIEEYSALENELTIINDKMSMFGFSYNRIGNIKNFDNKRHYYSYIEADVEMITTNKTISNIIKSRFKQAFNRGVRFWNAETGVFSGTFSYTKQNYERSLE